MPKVNVTLETNTNSDFTCEILMKNECTLQTKPDTDTYSTCGIKMKNDIILETTPDNNVTWEAMLKNCCHSEKLCRK